MSGIRQAFDRLRAVRHIEWVMLCIACAAVLIVMGGTQEQGGTELERRMERVLECVQGAGEVRVMINQRSDSSVVGVIVVAQGAANLRVAMELRQAVQAVMDIEEAQIEVLSMDVESD